MVTTSELAATAVIWGLTPAGGFFGIRSVVRKKKSERADREKER